MTRLGAAFGIALLLGLGACREDLTVPGGCPDLCPGFQPSVQETVIEATLSQDSTYFGYVGFFDAAVLPVSNGIDAGESRAWFRFSPRPDSVLVDVNLPYTIDSVAFTLSLAARDTLAKNLRLYLHRVPATIDTLVGFEELDGLLTEASLIDSILVDDTLRTGQVRVAISGEGLSRVEIPEADDGVVAIGVRVGADRPTGVRLNSIVSAPGQISFLTYARVDLQDTTRQRHTLTMTGDGNGFARDTARVLEPDLLYVGGVPSARSLIRFELPPVIKDTAVLLRVVLEVEPAAPLLGIPNVPTFLEARAITADLGGKSPPTFGIRFSTALPVGSTDPVEVEVQGIVETWRGTRPLPSVIYLSLAPEVGTLMLPAFRSTRSATGAPRLRITYLIPGTVARP